MALLLLRVDAEMNKFKLGLILSLLATPILANPPAQQYNLPTTARNPSVPTSYITTTGIAQTIIPKPSVQLGPNFDCLIINLSAVNTIYLNFGEAATANGIPILPGTNVTCSGMGGTNQDYVSLYDASAGDHVYVLSTVLQSF